MKWLTAIVLFTLLITQSCGGAACMAPEPATHCNQTADCPNGYACDQVRRYCFKIQDAGLITPEAAIDASMIDATHHDSALTDTVLADTAQADVVQADTALTDTVQSDAGHSDTASDDTASNDTAFADHANDAASEDAANGCDSGFFPVGDAGWCVREVIPATVTPSGGPCGGEVMCLLDLENNGSGAAGADGKDETFCVWAYGLSQTAFPTNGHTPIPDIPDPEFPVRFGDFYAANSGLTYRLATAPISLDFRPMRLENGYLCLSFAGALNSANYILIPISNLGHSVNLLATNPQCLEMMVNADDRRGLCPVDTGNTSDFVQFRADEVCTTATSGSVTESVCELYDTQWAFGFYYDGTGLRAR